MRTWYERMRALRHISFKWKLVCIFSTIMTIIACLIVALLYYISVDQVMDISKNMAYEILQKNMSILDERLTKIKENSMQAVSDDSLFAYLSNEEELAKENYLGLDRKITQVLNKYFSSEDVMSVQLITDHYTYGVNTNLLTAQRFKESSLYKRVLENKGALFWTPVYDIVSMYQLDEYRDSDLPNRWVFSAARTLGEGYVNSDGFFETKSLDSSEKPVLLINFSEDILKTLFEDSMPVQGVETYLLAADGNCIYHNGSNAMEPEALSGFYDEIKGDKQGTDILKIEGKECAVSYVTSEVTGWILSAVMPSDELMQTSRQRMQITAGVSILFAIIVGFLLSSWISAMVTRPIRQTVNAMQKLGAGRFDTQLAVKSQDEFGYLASGFNLMNQHIAKLIEDNYASKLRENEMEITALNLQLNPHFLYNTLSVINYEAIDTGCENVSDMIMHLCNMLRYPLADSNETSLFWKDLEWLQDYVDIMKFRFENKFTVVYDIPESLKKIQVPKLFLQPFIENAILHGFEYMDSGGMITVTARQEGEDCAVEICDNGIGMDSSEETLPPKRTVGTIGIANIRQRIRLLYGENYGVKISSKIGEGTRILVTFPINIKP